MFTTSMAHDLNRVPNKVGAESFSSMITRLMPNGTAPIFGMTSMLDDETAVQYAHSFFTKTMVFPSYTMASASGAGATTLTGVDSSELIPGMILETPAREHVLVTDVPSATTITVTRGIGRVAPASIPNNSVLYQVGNASEEGSVKPQAKRLDAVRVTNLTQIFRNAWAVTGTAAATAVIAGDSHVAENQLDCAAFHARDIETAIIFGQQYEGIRNGQPFRKMDGLIESITRYAPSQIYTAGSTTNATQLEDMLDPCFDQTTDPKNANERALFVGAKAFRVINTICRLNGNYHLVDGQTGWGLQFSTFRTTRGKFQIVEHPLLNSNSVWSEMAIAVDFATFNLAYLAGRKTSEKRYDADGSEAVSDAIDASGGVLTSELTAVIKNPAANAVIKGLKAGAEG